MQKIIFSFLILLFAVPLFAQGSINGRGSNGQNWVSQVNSSSITLSSNAAFTGPWELCWDYAYISMVVKSNQSSAAAGWKIQFSKSGSAETLLHEQNFTYTANDSTTNAKLVRVVGSYYRVIYTNTNFPQSLFLLETRLHAKDAMPLISNGIVSVDKPFVSENYGVFVVGTTAIPLSGSSINIYEVEVTNNTVGSTLYVGYNSGVTSSNGFPLAYRDTYRIKISNLNKIYLIGSTAIDVRYVYYNY